MNPLLVSQKRHQDGSGKPPSWSEFTEINTVMKNQRFCYVIHLLCRRQVCGRIDQFIQMNNTSLLDLSIQMAL